MATQKFLDSSGLTYFWGKIKAWAKRTLVDRVFYDGNDKTIKMVKYDGTNDAEHITSVVSAATIVSDGGGVTDISGKADKVTGATAGDVATLDLYGNLVDSGKTLGISVPSNAVFTDTKNTAGSTDSSSKLYIIGATGQSANPQTYSQDTAYIGTDGHLYSDSKQVVNLTGTQSMTNKTYNGLKLTQLTSGFIVADGTTEGITLTVEKTYTLNEACAKPVDSSISAGSTSTNLPTSAAVEARIASAIQSAQVGAAVFKGIVNSGTEISSLTAYSSGWYWVVGTAGTYVGQTCEAGDTIFCVSDYSSAYSASDFNVVQTNLDIAAITNSEIDTITAS